MARARDLPRDGDQLGEREMLSVLRPHAEAEPRRAAVAHDLPALRRLLEECERRTQAVAELRAVHAEQLLLRIVEVVHIDRSAAAGWLGSARADAPGMTGAIE